MFLRDTEGILFCVPMTNRRKFDRFAFYCQSMLNKRSGDLPKVIAGTMCDLNNNEVSEADGRDLARYFNCEYFHTSAKADINVSQPFLALAQLILDSRGPNMVEERKDKENCLLM